MTGTMRMEWKSARRTAIVAMLAATTGLAGCETVGGALGIGKSAPDEYAVAPRRPLVMPPDVELRPPQPGATGPSDVNAQGIAAQALATSGQNAGSTPAPAEESQGQGRVMDTTRPPVE